MTSRAMTFVVFLAVATIALAVTPALALAVPSIAGVSVQTSTSVKVIFTQPVSTGATTLSDYAVSPALTLKSATLVDSGDSVLLTTGTQVNGQTYTVTVTGVTGADGTSMTGPGTGTFIGTNLGANTATSGKDDFNRPSGLVTTDTPIPGPWLSTDINTLNRMFLIAGPTFGGTGALYSHVSDTDPERDNAFVRYATTGRDYYLSAYVFIPSSQGWGSQQEIGLIRMMQSMYTSQARVSAIDQSSAQYYSLNVNWKTTGNVYIGPRIVTTNIPFDTWHWIEMHVRDSSSTAPGEIQVWIDGKLDFQQNTQYVYPAGMTYAQVGIMHLVTLGPAATTISDEVRFGNAFQLPSAIVDTTAPTATLDGPSAGTTIGGTMTFSATATDDYQLQRVDFLVDNKVVARDDYAPYSVTYDTTNLTSGTHTFSAQAYDTSGNRSTLSGVTLTKP